MTDKNAPDYETSDINVKYTIWVGVITLLVLSLLMILLWMVLNWQQSLYSMLASGFFSQAQSSVQTSPPLRPDPPRELHQLIQQAEDRLSSQGWVDREKNIIHIPIERAMERYVEKQEKQEKQEKLERDGKNGAMLRPEKLLRPEKILDAAVFQQNIGAQLPLHLEFINTEEKTVRLDQLLNNKPALLALSWYQCSGLCPIALHHMARQLRHIRYHLPKDFQIIQISIDPRDSPQTARAIKQELLNLYGNTTASEGWHVLTGAPGPVRQLADQVGFRYAYDAKRKQFSHPAGITLLTAQGIVSSYLFGVDYSIKDLNLALTEAGQGKLGSPLAQLILRCFHFDPDKGVYTLAILNLARIAGLLTVVIMLITISIFLIKQHRLIRKEASPR